VDSGGGGVRLGRVRLADDVATGMTGGPRLSATAGAVTRRWADGGATGRLGQTAALGCNGGKE
jgi:hypothetical protein